MALVKACTGCGDDIDEAVAPAMIVPANNARREILVLWPVAVSVPTIVVSVDAVVSGVEEAGGRVVGVECADNEQTGWNATHVIHMEIIR